MIDTPAAELLCTESVSSLGGKKQSMLVLSWLVQRSRKTEIFCSDGTDRRLDFSVFFHPAQKGAYAKLATPEGREYISFLLYALCLLKINLQIRKKKSRDGYL